MCESEGSIPCAGKRQRREGKREEKVEVEEKRRGEGKRDEKKGKRMGGRGRRGQEFKGIKLSGRFNELK